MKVYKLIVRGQLIMMGRLVTDEDRKVLNFYYETPTFHANSSYEDVEILEDAYERFCTGKVELHCIESVELVRIV